jgi:hypothetical protein
MRSSRWPPPYRWRQVGPTVSLTPVVYDAGALVAADRNVREVWADHRVRLEAEIVPAVPAPVVAQVSRPRRRCGCGGCCADAR